ncbi:MAG: hypothetical protein ACK4YV_05750 [Emticicia sp.]
MLFFTFRIAFTQERPNKYKGYKLAELNLLTIKNLSFRFAGKSQLLKNISLTVRKGKITALLGVSRLW